jgi:hypothetical protein
VLVAVLLIVLLALLVMMEMVMGITIVPMGISFVLLEAAFVLHEYRQLFGIARFPVGQVGLQDHVGSLKHPTKLGLVGKPDTNIEHAFFEDVLGPGHHFASDSGVVFIGLLRFGFRG